MIRTEQSSPEQRGCPRPGLKGREVPSRYDESDKTDQRADKQRSQDHARYDKATRGSRSKISLLVVGALNSQTCRERRAQCLPPSQPGYILRDFCVCRRVNRVSRFSH